MRTVARCQFRDGCNGRVVAAAVMNMPSLTRIGANNTREAKRSVVVSSSTVIGAPLGLVLQMAYDALALDSMADIILNDCGIPSITTHGQYETSQ